MVISGAAVLAQVVTFLADYGETLTLDSGGSTRTVTGFCTWAPRGGLQPDSQDFYFDDNDLVALTQPVLAVYLDGTVTPPGLTDTFTRDGRTFTVRASAPFRVGNTIVLYIVFGD